MRLEHEAGAGAGVGGTVTGAGVGVVAGARVGVTGTLLGMQFPCDQVQLELAVQSWFLVIEEHA